MNTLVAFVDAGDDKVDYAFACHPDVLVEQVGGGIRLGVRGLDTRLTAATIRTIMKCAIDSRLGSNAKITWAFSSVAVSVGDLGAMLSRWDDTGEPPLLSIIALDIGADRHVTRGMAAFTGYEFAAQFSDSSQSRDAARNLARLARHALVTGDLRRDVDYEGIDGRPLQLMWHDISNAPRMVTIVF